MFAKLLNSPDCLLNQRNRKQFLTLLLINVICILLLISTLGVGLGCIAFGFFTYFANIYGLQQLIWLPLVLMVAIIYVGNVGISGIFFVVLVQLFPDQIRSAGTSISVVFLSILVFVTLNLFPLLLHYFGISATMWLSAFGSLLTFVYFMSFLPETKGKSMITD